MTDATTAKEFVAILNEKLAAGFDEVLSKCVSIIDKKLNGHNKSKKDQKKKSAPPQVVAEADSDDEVEDTEEDFHVEARVQSHNNTSSHTTSRRPENNAASNTRPQRSGNNASSNANFNRSGNNNRGVNNTTPTNRPTSNNNNNNNNNASQRKPNERSTEPRALNYKEALEKIPHDLAQKIAENMDKEGEWKFVTYKRSPKDPPQRDSSSWRHNNNNNRSRNQGNGWRPKNTQHD